MRHFLGYLTFLFVLGGVTLPVNAEENLDPLPPWNYQELVDAATVDWGFKSGEIRTVHVLAWNRELDRQDREIENVLCLLRVHVDYPKKFYKDKSDLWVLVTMSRYPQRSEGWLENARVGGHGAPGIVILEYAPHNEDVYKFLGQGWDFESNRFFRLVEGKVRVNTWMQTIGEAPTRFHTGEQSSSPGSGLTK